MRRKPALKSAIAALVLGLSLLPAPGLGAPQPSPPQIEARAALLLDQAAKAPLFDKNADAPIAPASLAKLMTLFLAFQAMESDEISPNELVVIPPSAAKTGGAGVDLEAGQQVSLLDLCAAMAVVSANDAAEAVAERLGPGREAFVARMNQTACSLGLADTRYHNPTGLPAPGQVTTARDVATLAAAYVERHPRALELHARPRLAFGAKTYPNRNTLLHACAGVDGLKTGSIRDSGFCLAATALRGGRRLVAVVLGARTETQRDQEACQLLEYGFACPCPVPASDHRNSLPAPADPTSP